MARAIARHHVPGSLDRQKSQWQPACLPALKVPGDLPIASVPLGPFRGFRQVQTDVDPRCVAHVRQDKVGVTVIDQDFQLTLGRPVAVVGQLALVIKVIVQSRGAIGPLAVRNGGRSTWIAAIVSFRLRYRAE